MPVILNFNEYLRCFFISFSFTGVTFNTNRLSSIRIHVRQSWEKINSIDNGNTSDFGMDYDCLCHQNRDDLYWTFTDWIRVGNGWCSCKSLHLRGYPTPSERNAGRSIVGLLKWGRAISVHHRRLHELESPLRSLLYRPSISFLRYANAS